MSKTNTKKPKPHKKSPSNYRVTNWPEHNQALKDRGSLTVWVAEEALETWQGAASQNQGKLGAPYHYPDAVIELILQLGVVFHQPLRQTEGLAGSILKLLGLDLDVPDYTTLCRRRSCLPTELPKLLPKDLADIIFDSTGLKFYGEGEWKRRVHGASKRRRWRKLHLGIDRDGEIRAELLTPSSVNDANAASDLLQQYDEAGTQIGACFGDGIYDQRKVYDPLLARNVTKVMIPPQKGAHIWIHGNSKAPPHPRDENLRDIRRTSRTGWKQRSSYHTRSLIETTMFRYKRIIGERCWSRSLPSQRVETRIGLQVLNRMLELGVPESKWQGSPSLSSRARALAAS